MNRCIPSLAFDDVVHAAEQDQIGNIVNAEFVKDSSLVGSYSFVANVK